MSELTLPKIASANLKPPPQTANKKSTSKKSDPVNLPSILARPGGSGKSGTQTAKHSKGRVDSANIVDDAFLRAIDFQKQTVNDGTGRRVTILKPSYAIGRHDGGGGDDNEGGKKGKGKKSIGEKKREKSVTITANAGDETKANTSAGAGADSKAANVGSLGTIAMESLDDEQAGQNTASVVSLEKQRQYNVPEQQIFKV
jgi:hypothetical protein